MYQLERRPDQPFDCTTCEFFRKPLLADPEEVRYHCFNGVYMPKWSAKYMNCKFALCDLYKPTPESGIVISDIEKELINRHLQEQQMRKNYYKIDKLAKKEADAKVYFENEKKAKMRKNKGTSIFDYDYAVYDAPEGEEYVQGYAIGVYVPNAPRVFRDIKLVIDNPTINMYAYIPTEYVTSSEIPCGLCYFVFASDFEYRIGVQELRTKRYGLHKFSLMVLPTNPIWFHRGWILPTYDPTKYDTYEKKYKKMKNRAFLFTEEERMKCRIEYSKAKECYKPKSDSDDNCANCFKGFKNSKVCYVCGASIHGKQFLTENLPRKPK